MWVVYGTGLTMTEGDFGVELPVTVSGATLGSGDTLKFTFKEAKNGEVLLTKEYANPVNNTVSLVLTEADSELFEVNHSYVYSLDWYHGDTFLCNVIPQGVFMVEDKV